jgi:hypothetical protein
MLYCTLIRSKLQYASVVWNSITSHASKPECIQQKFFNLCHRHFYNRLQWNYINVLITWNSLLPSLWRCHINTLFHLMSTTIQNFSLLFWKLLVFIGKLEISKILFCLMLNWNAATVLLLDALQQLMPHIRILVYSTGLFWWVIC